MVCPKRYKISTAKSLNSVVKSKSKILLELQRKEQILILDSDDKLHVIHLKGLGFSYLSDLI